MSDLATTLELINYAFVLFFGVVVSLYLADINFMDYKSLYIFTLLGFGAAQGIFYLLMGESLLYRCYPLLIHLPFGSPDLACVSPEFLCCGHCSIIRVSAVYP